MSKEERTPTEVVKLLYDVAVDALRGQRAPGRHRRLRIAVTPAEYAAVEEYMVSNHGYAAARILDVPLVVEDAPEDPPLLVRAPTTRTT